MTNKTAMTLYQPSQFLFLSILYWFVNIFLGSQSILDNLWYHLPVLYTAMAPVVFSVILRYLSKKSNKNKPLFLEFRRWVITFRVQ